MKSIEKIGTFEEENAYILNQTKKSKEKELEIIKYFMLLEKTERWKKQNFYEDLNMFDKFSSLPFATYIQVRFGVRKLYYNNMVSFINDNELKTFFKQYGYSATKAYSTLKSVHRDMVNAFIEDQKEKGSILNGIDIRMHIDEISQRFSIKTNIKNPVVKIKTDKRDTFKEEEEEEVIIEETVNINNDKEEVEKLKQLLIEKENEIKLWKEKYEKMKAAFNMFRETVD